MKCAAPIRTPARWRMGPAAVAGRGDATPPSWIIATGGCAGRRRARSARCRPWTALSSVGPAGRSGRCAVSPRRCRRRGRAIAERAWSPNCSSALTTAIPAPPPGSYVRATPLMLFSGSPDVAELRRTGGLDRHAVHRPRRRPVRLRRADPASRAHRYDRRPAREYALPARESFSKLLSPPKRPPACCASTVWREPRVGLMKSSRPSNV